MDKKILKALVSSFSTLGMILSGPSAFASDENMSDNSATLNSSDSTKNIFAEEDAKKEGLESIDFWNGLADSIKLEKLDSIRALSDLGFRDLRKLNKNLQNYLNSIEQFENSYDFNELVLDGISLKKVNNKLDKFSQGVKYNLELLNFGRQFELVYDSVEKYKDPQWFLVQEELCDKIKKDINKNWCSVCRGDNSHWSIETFVWFKIGLIFNSLHVKWNSINIAIHRDDPEAPINQLTSEDIAKQNEEKLNIPFIVDTDVPSLRSMNRIRQIEENIQSIDNVREEYYASLKGYNWIVSEFKKGRIKAENELESMGVSSLDNIDDKIKDFSNKNDETSEKILHNLQRVKFAKEFEEIDESIENYKNVDWYLENPDALEGIKKNELNCWKNSGVFMSDACSNEYYVKSWIRDGFGWINEVLNSYIFVLRTFKLQNASPEERRTELEFYKKWRLTGRVEWIQKNVQYLPDDLLKLVKFAYNYAISTIDSNNENGLLEA